MKSGASETADKAIRKRNKATLVCTNCKKRKIKCDRKMPCSTCVKSNTGYSCTYESKWRPISFNGTLGEQAIDEGLSNGSIMATSLQDTASTSPLQHSFSTHSHDNSRLLIDTKPGPSSALDELALLRSKLNQLENSLTKKDSPSSSYSSPTLSHSESASTFHSIPTQGSANVDIDEDDDVINFYEGYSTAPTKGTFRRTSFGPLAWVSIMRRDPWLSLVWKNIDKNILTNTTGSVPAVNKENTMVFNSAVEANSEAGTTERSFQKKNLEIEGYAEIVPFKLSQVQQNNTRWNLNVTNLTLAKTLFEGKCDPALQLIEKIKQILPKKKVLWSLIDKFFTNLYPFNPFLDEIEFRKELSLILGPISYEDEPLDQVNIEKKLDLAYIATCLFVLRLTYVSLFSNRDCMNAHILESEEMTEDKYLLTNPINLSVIDVARACIECFQITRKFNLAVFQAVLFMRLYSNQAPEEGDGIDGGDSQVAMGTLVQMAYSLGLHREPDNFAECTTDERSKNLGRKLWHFLLRTDIVNCYSIGNLPQTDEKYYDTKVPYINERNSNISDVDMEMHIAQSYDFNRKELSPFSGVLSSVLDLHNGCKMKMLVADVEKTETSCDKVFNMLPFLQNMDTLPMALTGTQYIFVVKSKVFITIKFSLISIYFHLYLHYESRTKFEATFHYLMKIYNIITEDLLPYSYEVLYGRLSNQGLNLNPAVQMAIHKSNQFCMSNLTRINFLKFSMESKQDHEARLKSDHEYRVHYNRIVTLSNSIKSTIDALTKIFEKFASRYYYAWRVCKAYRLLLKYLKREDFYKRPPAVVKKLHSFQYTAHQLDQITRAVQKLGKSADAIVHYEDSYGKVPENPVMSKNPMKSPLSMTKSHSSTTVLQGSTKMERSETPSSMNDTPESVQSSNNQELDQMWLSMMVMKPEQDLNAPLIEDSFLMDPVNNRSSFSGSGVFPSMPTQHNNGHFDFSFMGSGHPSPMIKATTPGDTLTYNQVNLDHQQNLQRHNSPQNPTPFPAFNTLFPGPGNNVPYSQSPASDSHASNVTSNPSDDAVPLFFSNESDMVALYNLEQLLS